MALGPKDFTENRKKQLLELERIIDEAIEATIDDSNIKIDTCKLKGIAYHFTTIKNMYLKAGWKDVLIDEYDDFRDSYSYLVLKRK